MQLLLGSGGFRTEERIQFLTGLMKSFFGPIRRLLFVPYALADHDGYVNSIIERGLHAGYELDRIHKYPDPVAAVRSAEGLFMGGGNTFRLLHELYGRGLLLPIRERVHAGLPYLGVSAGTNVACPTIKTTNDMPIVQPPSFAALGLVPFQVNPHYYHGATFLQEGTSYRQHFSETRDDRIREFHEMNDLTVVGLWEGGVLRLEHDRWQLLGAGARLFTRGQPPVDVAAGATLDALG